MTRGKPGNSEGPHFTLNTIVGVLSPDVQMWQAVSVLMTTPQDKRLSGKREEG